ncbi:MULTISPECIES: GNAT family N-acetyltransferase [Pseudomonas]|uniref:GNAT family N-acetyltransferase n=1 Tax=Pseudomonas TaxID=286 RepID=UPI001AE9C2F2|nr:MULTISPECIES: GNAT family N-acetyltransferase [unclassified Pseudomonas]WQG58596.1 GNAT family N-acetyltransferase [Pseudomonas sp. RTB3]MBP1128284.1 GNAT superfamily N-acetyltransferase [Pseudomonas sp. PvP025]MDQ0397221.1 GNAT superfamily N-acetyltransferase [Pseudomonas sp. PvP006]MEB0107143.1 GNAT family N-acetyltransferase [Pseudomonas sp. MH9.3]WPX79123.1 GNAT family N-acetyltransferase [Pseudomonas sp. MH9.3]
MPNDSACELSALYQKTDEHFYSATCLPYRCYGSCVSTYFIDESDGPQNLLIVRLGCVPSSAELAAALALIRRTTLPIRLVMHEQKVETLRELLTGLGFRAADVTSAMALQLLPFTSMQCNGAVQISLTRNLTQWAVPLVSAFSSTPVEVAHYQQRHERALEAGEALYHFVLSADGQVASSLTLSMCDGAARINDFGTVAGFRGKGYGTRLIQTALLHAWRLGGRFCFLEATSAATSLYRALGFERLFDYQTFVRGPVAQA